MKKNYTHIIKFMYLRINICSKIYAYKIKTNVFYQAVVWLHRNNTIFFIFSPDQTERHNFFKCALNSKLDINSGIN